MENHGKIKEAQDSLLKAKAVVALTGAGISAESGVPTFRGKDGLWKNYSAQDLATPQAFQRDPRLVWEWYQWRRRLIASVSFNAGHRALAQLEALVGDFLLITQNVDGLHRLAGSRQVVEIHGSIWRTLCTGCGKGGENRDLDLPLPPRCPECAELIRPDVVWFGESLDRGVLDQATRALANCDTMLVVGTSGVVQPAASFPFMAKDKGALVIEVNLEKTPISNVAHLSLFGKAAEILPRLVPSRQ